LGRSSKASQGSAYVADGPDVGFPVGLVRSVSRFRYTGRRRDFGLTFAELQTGGAMSVGGYCGFFGDFNAW